MSKIHSACYKCDNTSSHKLKYNDKGDRIFFCDRCWVKKDLVKKMKDKANEDDKRYEKWGW